MQYDRYSLTEYDDVSRGQYGRLRYVAEEMLKVLVTILPARTERYRALTKLDECVMWAERCIELEQRIRVTGEDDI